MSAFTTIIDSPEEAVELVDKEEELMESKFEKMDEQDDIHTAYSKLYKVFEKYEKLYRLATRKLSEVELEIVSESKNDKRKSILGAPLNLVKKESKQNDHRSTNKKSQSKKPHLCHYGGALRHTRPNCYKWLATQQSNNVSSFGSQNQLQLALAPLEELLKAIMLLSNFNGFNSPSYPSKQRFMQKKGSPSRSPICKEKDSK